MLDYIKNHLVEIAVIFFTIAFFMPLFTYVLYSLPYPEYVNGLLGVDNIGSTGDFIAGTMTPILTIAAFFLLLKGYFMQKEELEQSRIEMAKSADALKSQLEVMRLEKEEVMKKNELEIFFLLFQNWKNSIYEIKLLTSCQHRVPIDESRPNIEFGKEKLIECNIIEYYDYIKSVIDTVRPVGMFSFIEYLQGHNGDLEVHLIKKNIGKKLTVFYIGFNNIVEYISTCKYNKAMMCKTLKAGLTDGEQYLLCLIASDFVLGTREVGSEREKLYQNLKTLGINRGDSHDGVSKNDD